MNSIKRTAAFLFCLMTGAVSVFGEQLINNHTAGDLPVLVPSVRDLKMGKGFFHIPEKLRISFPENARNEAEQLKKLFSKYHTSSQVLFSPKNAEITLILSGKVTPENEEAYTLAVMSREIRLTAPDRKGLFCGVQTIGNLLLNYPEELPCCIIKDAPLLAERGVFMVVQQMTDRELPEFLHLVEVLAELKINTLYLEFAENIPMKDTPFTARKQPVISLASIRKIQKAAEQYHMEIVPYIQCVTHVRWLNTHPQYADRIVNLSSRVKSNTWRVSYCPKKKLGRELTERVIRETIALLKPKRFHLAMDEFPVCDWDKCDSCPKGHTSEEMAQEVAFFEGLVRKMKVTPIIAHDSLRNYKAINGEIALARLNRSTVIQIWDYLPEPSEQQVNNFLEHGFRFFNTASWMQSLENAMTSPRLAKKKGGSGTVLTYWGYQKEPWSQLPPRAAAGTVLAAQYAWNPEEMDFLALPYDPAYEFYRRVIPSSLPRTDYTPVDLGNSFNVRLGTNEAFPSFTLEQARKIRALLETTPEKFLFAPGKDGSYGAVEFPSQKGRQVKLPLNRTVKALSFLMTATRPADDFKYSGLREEYEPAAAFLIIRYGDKSSFQKRVTFRGAVTDWNSETSGRECRFVLRGNDKDKNMYNFVVYDWTNPFPEKHIESILLAGKPGSKSRVVLLALSAVGGDQKAPTAVRPKEDAISTLQEFQEESRPRLTDITFLEPGSAGKLEITTDDATISPILRKVIMVNEKPMLELTVPPVKPGMRTRISGTLVLPPDSKIKTVYGDYALLDMPDTAKVHTGFYVLPKDQTKTAYRVLYDFHKRQAFEKVQQALIPVKAMTEDLSGKIPDKDLGRIRLSFWLSGHKKPVRLLIGEMGYSSDECGYLPAPHKDQLPK